MPDTARLVRTFAARFTRWSALIEQFGPSRTSDADRAVSYVCIQAVNEWNEFSRRLFFASALQWRDLNGTPIAHAHQIANPGGALTFAIHTLAPKKRNRLGPWSYSDEPTWRQPSVLLSLLTALGSSNHSHVANGLSTTTAFFDSAPAFRNFFAHRNPDTSRKVRQRALRLGISPTLHPVEILCSTRAGAPSPLLVQWLDEVRIVASRVA
jgi:hypothetical protein